jgi:hypothetical protein
MDGDGDDENVGEEGRLAAAGSKEEGRVESGKETKWMEWKEKGNIFP